MAFTLSIKLALQAPAYYLLCDWGKRSVLPLASPLSFRTDLKMFTKPVDKPASGFTNVQQSSTCCTVRYIVHVVMQIRVLVLQGCWSGMLGWLGHRFNIVDRVSFLVHPAQIVSKFVSVCMHVERHFQVIMHALQYIWNKLQGQNLFVTWLL